MCLIVLPELGFAVAQSTVAKYMVRKSDPSGQSWGTFLRNHAPHIAAIESIRGPSPPPARRTCSFGSGAASRSSSPRLIVERASPVIFDTAARPPQPALRTSPAANNRRPRSSSFEPTVSHHCQIAFSSIMRPTYTRSPRTGIPQAQVTPPHDRCSEVLKQSCVLSPTDRLASWRHLAIDEHGDRPLSGDFEHLLDHVAARTVECDHHDVRSKLHQASANSGSTATCTMPLPAARRRWQRAHDQYRSLRWKERLPKLSGPARGLRQRLRQRVPVARTITKSPCPVMRRSAISTRACPQLPDSQASNCVIHGGSA